MRRVYLLGIQCLLYLIERKASILQKTRLLGAFAQTLRCPTTELLAMDAPDMFQPLDAAHIQPALDGLLVDPLFLQLPANAQRPVAAAPAGADERLDKTIVRQQTLRFERRYDLCGNLRRTPLFYKLVLKFPAAVLATG